MFRAKWEKNKWENNENEEIKTRGEKQKKEEKLVNRMENI